MFPKNSDEFVEFLINIGIIITFWITTKYISDYLKEDLNIYDKTSTLTDSISDFLRENDCECSKDNAINENNLNI